MSRIILLAAVILTCGAVCPKSSINLACGLLVNKNLTLATAHASIINDSAIARNNIQDMCEGKEAQRSSYSCSECKTSPAPGGTVCISEAVLKWLTKLVKSGKVYVNELAGACHSCGSKHYEGRAVDLKKADRGKEYLDSCKSISSAYGQDEVTHIHCQI